MKTRIKRTKVFYPTLAAIAIQLALQSHVGFAQENTVSDEDETEIIQVTARKNSESLYEVPVAITAFSAADIEERGLQDVLDLSAITPGFQYEKFATLPGRFDNSPRFRGVSVNTGSPTRQTASIFIDGVYISDGAQGIGLEDVERVEIIKGPQSAYFGRLTFAGAVNYVTKTPGEDLRARISVGAATKGDSNLQASIEGSLFGSENVKGRLSASTRTDGSHYSTSDGGELGKEKTESIGATLFFEPTENFSARVRAFYFTNEDGAPASNLVGFNFHNCGPFGGTDTTICGDIPFVEPDVNTVISDGLLNKLGELISLNGPNRTETGLDRESLRLSAQFSYSIPDTSMEVTGLIGKNDSEVRILRDADDSADIAFFSYANRKFEDTSIELRLSGEALNEKLTWSVGVNTFDQEFTNNGEFIVPPLGFFAFGGGELAQEKINTKGIFGALSYDVTDVVTVSIEGRYQKDTVEEDDELGDDTPFSKGDFTNFLPRFIVDWKLDSNELLYASYSEGNLPGGFNGAVAALTPSELEDLRAIQSNASSEFNEEKLINYELGWKKATGNYSLSLAAFFMDRTNQTFRRSDRIPDPTSEAGATRQINYFINAGKSEAFGAEVDFDYQVSDMFRIETSAAWIKSEFKVFNSGNYNEIFGTEDAGGQTSDRFPKFSGSASGIFEGEFDSGLEWFARADGFYQGSSYTDEINLLEIDANTQLNLRAGVLGDSYRLEFYVSNATNDGSYTGVARFRDLSNATPLFDFSTFGYQGALRDKRQFGFRFSYTYE